MDRIFTNLPTGPMANVNDTDANGADSNYEASVKALINDAGDYDFADLAPFREESMRYYYGISPELTVADAPDATTIGELVNDDSTPSQSTIVSTDVRDTVMSIMPSLMRIFGGTEHVVLYQPNTQNDVELAEQATDYVRYKFWEENEGFTILHATFKDALMLKTGIVKWWTETKTERKQLLFRNITPEQLQGILLENPKVQAEVVDGGKPDPKTGMIPSVTVGFVKSTPSLRVDNIPPDEFRISRRAKNLDTTDLVGQEMLMRAGELIEMGYDADMVYENVSGIGNHWNVEREIRNHDSDLYDITGDLVLYGEYYIRIDKDGDGINELRRICTMGHNYEIVDDIVANDVDIAVFGPDPRPHTLVGDSIAELVMDIQKIKTNILRGSLDSLAQSIFPRTVINEMVVNVDDALSTDLGAVIRTKGDPATSVISLTTPFVGQEAFGMLAQMDAVRQSRTGISEASKGVDPKALQSTNVMGIDAIVTGAQERIELIARILAEGGMKRLFRGMLREIVNNPNEEETVKLRGKWVTVNPSLFDPNMRVLTNPTLGKGSDATRLAALMEIKNAQTAIVAAYGLGNPVVGPNELRNTIVDIAAIANIKNVDRYFKPIPPELAQQIQAAPKEPAPEMVMAQAAMEKVRSETAAKIADTNRHYDTIAQDNDFKRDKLAIDSLIALATLAKEDPSTASDNIAKFVWPIIQGHSPIKSVQRVPGLPPQVLPPAPKAPAAP